jgi:hypothetical protein
LLAPPLTTLAYRCQLKLRWRDDVPLELVATYPAQAGLSLELSLGLDKGMVHCWAEVGILVPPFSIGPTRVCPAILTPHWTI